MNGRPKYTDNASRVIAWAEEFAKQYGAESMDTEHILMGLLKAEGGLARKVLNSVGVKPSDIQDRLNKVVQKKPRPTSTAPPAAKRVIQNAQREAVALGHGWVGTSISFWPCSASSGIAAQVLTKAGVELRLREKRSPA